MSKALEKNNIAGLDPLTLMKQNQVPQNPFSARSNDSDNNPYFRKVQVSPGESAFIEIKNQQIPPEEEVANPYKKTEGFENFQENYIKDKVVELERKGKGSMVYSDVNEEEDSKQMEPIKKTIQTRKDQNQKHELENIQRSIERNRAFSQLDEKTQLSYFHINQLGFTKRKETKCTMRKAEIFGLNNALRDSYPLFDDVLYGETRQNPIFTKVINLKHNFQPQYLSKTLKREQDNFIKFFSKIQGQIVLTNYRLLFIAKPDQSLLNQYRSQHKFVKEFFNIPLGYISRIEKTLNTQQDVNQSNNNCIEIFTKDNRYFKIKFHFADTDLCQKLAKALDKNCYVDYDGQMMAQHFERSFTYAFKIDVNDTNWMNYRNGWSIYTDIREEASRQGIELEKPNSPFKLLDNSKYQICATYPKWIIVPKSMSMEYLIACSKFRTKNRMPALSYYYKGNGCSIWRCSQCMNGVFGKRVTEDEIMVQEIGKTANSSHQIIHNSRVIIYDARPYYNAQANKIKKGGFEDTKYYRNSEIIFCDIDNIHKVSSVFKGLCDIPQNPELFDSSKEFSERLENTGYFKLINRILNSANMVVDSLMQKNNVLVHCSDGWDRTAQMCALAQQMLDPYFRTLDGFIILINKDWLSFGHQFHLRFGVLDRNFKEEQRSPVFIQYLECVRQLMIQFPMHFEYNQELLLFLADEIHTNKYGTFIGNCERDRDYLQLENKTESIWTQVYLDKDRFINKFYNPKHTQDPIRQVPIIASYCLPVWREYFFKWSSKGYDTYNQDVTQSYMQQNTPQGQKFEQLSYTKQELIELLQQQKQLLEKLESQVKSQDDFQQKLAGDPNKLEQVKKPPKKSFDQRDQVESDEESQGFSIKDSQNSEQQSAQQIQDPELAPSGMSDQRIGEVE